VDNLLFLVHLQEKIYIYDRLRLLEMLKILSVLKASRLNVVAIDSQYPIIQMETPRVQGIARLVNFFRKKKQQRQG